MAKLESDCNQQRLVHTEAMHTLQQEHMRRSVAASALMEQYRSEAATRFAEASQNQDRTLVSALKKHARRAREQQDDAARAYAEIKRDTEARLLSAQQAHARAVDGLPRGAGPVVEVPELALRGLVLLTLRRRRRGAARAGNRLAPSPDVVSRSQENEYVLEYSD